jgi:hypothetical protein
VFGKRLFALLLQAYSRRELLLSRSLARWLDTRRTKPVPSRQIARTPTMETGAHSSALF